MSARATSLRVGVWVGAMTSVLLAGCYQDQIHIDDPDGSPPPWDAGVVLPPGKCVEGSGVDLLFVIDNSNSMAEEQASLAEQLPSFVRALVEPPDRDADGEPDWLPVTDLHVGVVTTDMGTDGITVPTCGSARGDDGVLRRAPGPGVVGCAPSYPSFAEYRAGTSTPEAFAAEVSCVAQAGTGGCGFEQQLEAALKALSPARPTAYTGPSYVPPTFLGGGAGHGDGLNAGFVRDDTLLAVVIVTDEEDCSVYDPEIFDPTSARFDVTDLNLRCFTYAGEAVHPIGRYVAGLSALRARRPDLLAIGLLVGVPLDLAVASPTSADFQRMLDDPRMEERVDPEMPSRLVPSCNVPGRGLAFPPRRLVALAQAFGPGRATVQSICSDDYTIAAASMARLLGTRACQRFEP